MFASVLKLGAVVSLALTAVAQSAIPNDIGNGVHVPGAIPAELNEPLQHRLAFHGSTGMTVSWSSFIQLSQPTVHYGTDPAKLDQVATSQVSTTYPTSRTYNNHVVLSGLKPATKYYYTVSFTNQGYAAYRPTYSFTTARAAGDMTSFSFAVYGDLGLMGHDGLSTVTGPGNSDTWAVLGPSETNTIQSLLSQKDTYDFMHHVGDIGYADYFLKESVQGLFGIGTNETQPSRQEVATQYESLSEQFFDQMQPITAEKPWMVTPGNHEANCDNGGVTDKSAHITYTSDYCLEGQTNFTFYREHYRMPSDVGTQGLENFWYSYDYGMAHFVSLDTETDLGKDLPGPIENATGNVNGPFGYPNQQINWLINDLRRVNRKKTPWVVVFLHRPWYTSTSPPTWPAWQQAFEKIFYDYGVDVYLNGHVHNYERFMPMFNGTVDPSGLNNPRAPWPILNGAAGHYDGLDHFDSGAPYNGSAFGDDQDFTWGRMTFVDAQHLKYELVASRNSSVIDAATLYKKR
ncbi:hypothetical protein JCM21900_004286 [Sporobolomyces salmonicolor]